MYQNFTKGIKDSTSALDLCVPAIFAANLLELQQIKINPSS
jgi:hypothetical protein